MWRIVCTIVCPISKLLNGWLHGDYDMPLSAYYGEHGPDCWLCRLMNCLESDHCIKMALRYKIKRQRLRGH